MSDLSATDETCTVHVQAGKFCERKSLPGAPFGVCLRHASQLLRYLNGVLPDDAATLLAAQELDRPRPDAEEVTIDADSIPEHRIPGDGVSIVYYIRVGELIKVGFSKNLEARFRGYPPDAILLAYEPGDLLLEKRRHREFHATLAYPREWFRPSQALVAHINTLRETPLTAAQLAA